jgi:hypothetical protein
MRNVLLALLVGSAILYDRALTGLTVGGRVRAA